MAYLTNDINLEVARGNIDRLSSINKFGANTDTANGTAEDVWDGGGTYPFPTNTFATGTVTAATAVVDDTVTVNGLVYTAVAGAAADFTQFSIDTGNNETATSLAAAITGDTRTGTAGDCTATSNLAVVTITTNLEGSLGNAITLASSDGVTLAVSGASFTGGSFDVITSMSQTANQAALVGANVEIQGLDINWNLVVQTVALDASDTTTAVTLTTPLIRVFRAKIMANVVTTSPVRIHNTGETTDYAIISIGKNQTLMALFTIPKNCRGFITQYYYGYVRDAVKDPDSVEFGLWAADRGNGYEFQIKNETGIPKQAAAPSHEFKPYLLVGEKTDIKVTALAEGAAASVHAGFDIILEQI